MRDRIKQWIRKRRAGLLARRPAVARGQRRSWDAAIAASLGKGVERRRGRSSGGATPRDSFPGFSRCYARAFEPGDADD